MDQKALRRKALYARLAYRKGAGLYQRMKEDSTTYATLSKREKRHLFDFETGDLLKRRKLADEAYGHGRDVEGLNIMERATLRAWTTDLLDEYFSE